MSTAESKRTKAAADGASHSHHRHHHHHHHGHGYSRREKRRMALRRLVSILLAFVLGGAMFCVVFFAEQSVGWESNRLMYRTVIGDGYAYNNVNLLRERLAELLEKRSLPESILDEFYDEDAIYREYSRDIEKALMEGETVVKDSEAFGKSFEAAVSRELSEEGASINSDVQKRLTELGRQAAASYEELLSVYYMKNFYDLAKTYIDRMKIAAVIAAFVAIAAVAALLKLYSYKHHGLEFVASGLLFSAILNGAAVAVLSRNGWIAQVGVGPESYREMLSAFYRKAAQFGIMITLVQIALMIAAVIVGQRLKKRR